MGFRQLSRHNGSARDAGIASGIDRSMAAAYDGLEKLLATMPLMKNLDHAA